MVERRRAVVRVATILPLFLLLLAAPARAQDDLLRQCATVTPEAAGAPQSTLDDIEPQFQFLCGQAVNALAAVQPGVGIAFSGGAHTLGTATTIGRRFGVLPRVSVTARVNGILADVPEFFDDYTPRFDPDGNLSTMGTVGAPFGSLQGDVTVGLYNGRSLGPTFGGLGAIDLLGSVSFIPAVGRVGLDDPIVNAGIGARVGLLQQGLVMPGISISGMYRTMLGDVTLGQVSARDPAEFSTDLSSLSLRAGISKGILSFDLSAGAGYDRYTSNVFFDWQLECPASRCGETYTFTTRNAQGERGIGGELTTAAWNVYGNVGLSLILLNVVGEVGYQKATEVVDLESLRNAGLPARAPTSGDLDGGRFFASIGVRLTL